MYFTIITPRVMHFSAFINSSTQNELFIDLNNTLTDIYREKESNVDLRNSHSGHLKFSRNTHIARHSIFV